jgi:glycosyltransferase involved in cell wall biosynthesis
VKVLHLAASDYAGGAARAMYRWHASLRRLGFGSKILCLNKLTTDKKVSVVTPDWDDSETIQRICLQRFFIDSKRTNYSNTFFSHPLGYVSIANHELVQTADLIHIHWTSLFFDWQEIRKIKALGKTVVLTPHDLWAVTGGCHYPKDCDGYLKECLNCPMLKEDSFQLISRSRTLKQGVIAEAVDAILSPSHWMDRTIGEVGALNSVQREVIPYCIDVSKFRGKPRALSKRQLGFDSDRLLVLFCAEYVTEGRKGLDGLLEVLKVCESRPELRNVLEQGAEFAVIGKGSDLIEIQTPFRVHLRGYVEAMVDLCTYYSAADLLIYLGVEDNLPNVILEAMAIGLPVLAFDTGGVADMVTDGVTGHLIRRGDVISFAEKLVVLLRDSKKLSWLALNGSETIRRRFSENVVGLELWKLYETLGQGPIKSLPAKPSVSEKNGFEYATERTMAGAMIEAYRSQEQKVEELQKESVALREQNDEAQQECSVLEDRLNKDQELIRNLRLELNQLEHHVATKKNLSLWTMFLQRLKDRFILNKTRRS